MSQYDVIGQSALVKDLEADIEQTEETILSYQSQYAPISSNQPQHIIPHRKHGLLIYNKYTYTITVAYLYNKLTLNCNIYAFNTSD